MYLAFVRSAFQTEFAYRGQLWAAIFGQLVQVFARIAIWMSVMASGAAVSGIMLSEMVTYAILGGTVLAAWDPSSMLYAVTKSLKDGDISAQLLRPVNYPLSLFATELGKLAYRAIGVVVPVVVIAVLVYGIRPPASVFHGAMFPLFWFLSFLLLFEFAAIGGMLAFWFMTAFTIDWLLWAVLALVSGQFVPLWFFPEWLANTVRYLPFSWIGFYPAALYLGKVGIAEALILLGVGAGWVVLLALAVAALWRRATLRITVQGG